MTTDTTMPNRACPSSHFRVLLLPRLLFYYFGFSLLTVIPTKVRRSCATATAIYKRVAEGSPYGSLLADAKTLFDDGEYEAALLQYERAALMGFEIGQSNAAYIYDRVRCYPCSWAPRNYSVIGACMFAPVIDWSSVYIVSYRHTW